MLYTAQKGELAISTLAALRVVVSASYMHEPSCNCIPRIHLILQTHAMPIKSRTPPIFTCYCMLPPCREGAELHQNSRYCMFPPRRKGVELQQHSCVIAYPELHVLLHVPTTQKRGGTSATFMCYCIPRTSRVTACSHHAEKGRNSTNIYMLLYTLNSTNIHALLYALTMAVPYMVKLQFEVHDPQIASEEAAKLG